MDNFAWGNPENQETLSTLVAATRRVTMWRSGSERLSFQVRTSLYNATPLGDVAPTLLITALGIVPEIARCRTADFKGKGNSIYLIGDTKPELGGSEYYRLKGITGGFVPKLQIELASNLYRAVTRVADQDFVRSCHDISQGGLAVAVAEMCFASGCGADVLLPSLNSSKELQVQNSRVSIF